MGRPRKRLNDQPSEVVHENFLKQDPEGFQPAQAPNESTVVIANHVPEYRRVVFVNGRDPGCALHFHYVSKTHPLKHYTLYDGLEHELPVEVIDHLESCGEAQYGHKRDADGKPNVYVKGYKYIFQFRQARKIA